MQNKDLDSEYLFVIVTVSTILSFLFSDVCHFLTNILCRPSNEDEEYRRMRDRYEEEWMKVQLFWNPTKSWSQWMIHNVTPNKGSNDVTLPRTPKPSLLGLLSSKTLPLQPLSDNQCRTFCQNRFYFWTSSMKPAAVPESGPGQNWLQLWRTKQGKLSAKSFHPMRKNKNQETFPFFFLAAVISCVNIFSLFLSSLIWCVKKW